MIFSHIFHFIIKNQPFPSLKSIGYHLFIPLLLLPQISLAQKLSKKEINTAAEEKFPSAIFDLMTFLKLPNDGHFKNEIEQNLIWCDSIFSALEFKTQVIKTEGAPLLFAEKKVHQSLKTVLFYLQIDGQPVDVTE